MSSGHAGAPLHPFDGRLLQSDERLNGPLLSRVPSRCCFRVVPVLFRRL